MVNDIELKIDDLINKITRSQSETDETDDQYVSRIYNTCYKLNDFIRDQNMGGLCREAMAMAKEYREYKLASKKETIINRIRRIVSSIANAPKPRG